MNIIKGGMSILPAPHLQICSHNHDSMLKAYVKIPDLALKYEWPYGNSQVQHTKKKNPPPRPAQYSTLSQPQENTCIFMSAF